MDDKLQEPDEKKHRKVRMPITLSRQELNALYRIVPVAAATSRLLRHYFNAMAHLYGVIEVCRAWNIIHEQNPDTITEKDFLAFAEIARHENEYYYILGPDEIFYDCVPCPMMQREIIDVCLLDPIEEGYYKVCNGHVDKPFYVPEKETFLKYSDCDFYEETEQTLSLKDFLSKQFKLGGKYLDAIFNELMSCTHDGNACFTEALKCLDEYNLQLNGRKTAEQFVAIFTNMYNNTRMQHNCGYTPFEMIQMMPPEKRFPKAISFGPNIQKSIRDGTVSADEFREGIVKMNVPNEDLRQSMLDELERIKKTGMTS